MLIYLRTLFFCLALFPVIALAAPATSSTVSKTPAKAATAPAPAMIPLPATFDVMTFLVDSEGEKHKLIITSTPALMRIDKPDEAYSVIYNPANETYVGLEHSNYTYWEFSWPEIRAAVESSKRYASHLQELNLAGISTDSTPSTASTNAPVDTTTASVPDTSGYVWKQTPEHKTIAGLDCSKWTGETVSGDNVQAWCFNEPMPKIQTTVDRLRLMNEPMALVALRPVAPAFVFPIFSALVKGGVTPVLITWGANGEKNTFAFIKSETRPSNPALFAVPKLYMKTTLVSMDGLIDPKK